MHYARTLRVGFTVMLGAAFWVSLAGCTHNYYYGTPVTGCPPSTTTAPSGVQYGQVCEVPSQVVGGGTVIATNPPGDAPALGGPRPPRIVLSEPPSSRQAWRRADPDSGLATTRVQVGDDDQTIVK